MTIITIVILIFYFWALKFFNKEDYTDNKSNFQYEKTYSILSRYFIFR